ncbi:hypothetical protein HPB47_001115 [Ixodes persulcatus]|uniref:Uncharacterized protein n=1 Tax=Ixodes persulcatus TaxID=34615 RepID=A0AC60PRD9_IXOPE|nr:hypothetical protein HPB47_001115 [Ixodes persulcatus]
MAENLTQASDASPSTMQGIPTVAATDKSATSQGFNLLRTLLTQVNICLDPLSLPNGRNLGDLRKLKPLATPERWGLTRRLPPRQRRNGARVTRRAIATMIKAHGRPLFLEEHGGRPSHQHHSLNRDLKSGIAKTTGDFTYERGYQIRVQNFSNTVAVDIWQPHLVDHFLDLTSINTPTKDIPIQAFHAVGGDQVRGVIYGIDPNEDPEQLLPNLASTTHWILAARPMGKNSKTALVTFEGNRIPRRVWYHNIVRRVFPYRPKAVVCTHCHRIGHKSDICPNAQEQRCPDCGREHILTDGGCEETTPQCRNCGKAHLATDSSCQKWRDANKQLRIKAKPKRKSTNTKAPAGQTGQSQTTTTPKENTAEQSLPKSTAKRKATNLAPPPPPLADEHFPVLPQHEGSESKPSKGQGDHRVDQLADEMRKALKAPRKQTPPQHPDKPAPGRQPGRTTHTDQQQERLQSPAKQITNNRNKTVAFTSQSSQADIRPNFTLDDIRDIIRQEIKEILRTELPNMINPIVHEVVHALLQRQTTSLATTNINPPSNPNQHGHS